MPGPKCACVQLSPRQRQVIEKIASQQKAEHRLVQRATILLLADEQQSNSDIARDLHLKRDTVRKWRKRWMDQDQKLLALDEEPSQTIFHWAIVEMLKDSPRCGAPSKFSAEEVCQMLALACTPPQECGIPISHWDAPQLTKEVIRREIVPQISPRAVGRFLKSGRLKTPSNQKLVETGR